MPKVVEHQRRTHQPEPGDAYSSGAEVAHVGVQSLTAGQRQEHRCQQHEHLARLPNREVNCIQRVQRLQHHRCFDDALQTQHADDKEPEAGDRTEQGANATGTKALDTEQRNQHADSDRHDKLLEVRGGDAQPFDCRQHRYCGRDQRVTVKKRSSEHTQRRDDCQHARTGALPFCQSVGECRQRQHTALAIIVETQHQPDVLDRNDAGDCPEQGGEGRQNVLLIERHRMRPAERFLEGIQRAGTDVAVDDPECRERERGRA